MTDTSPPARQSIPSTVGGHLTERFAGQFRGRTHGLGQPLQLLVFVADMHGDCHADAVTEIARVAGVTEVRWVNRPDHPPRILADELRATLGRFPVRVIAANPDNDRPEPLVVLYDPWTNTAMLRSHTLQSDRPQDITLADLVDHALVHARQHADGGGTDPDQLADVQPALRCDTCGRIAGLGADASAQDEPGGACAAVNPTTSNPCAGTLSEVTITVAPAAEGRPVVHAVRRTNLDPPMAVDSLWINPERARLRKLKLNADVGPEAEAGRYETVAWGVNR